jgi:hypothetical protein
MRTIAFWKVGAVKATENTDNNCIISGDGFGMSASWVCFVGKHTIPQVVHAFPSFFKIVQSPDIKIDRISI